MGRSEPAGSAGPVVDRKLYVERWLLELKRRLSEGGLEAHVRAIDGRGGERVALAATDGGGAALALHYRKRRTGPAIVAAATGPEIVESAEEVHRAFVAEHRGWLENGLRRFGRRSFRILAALRAAFAREREVLEWAATFLGGGAPPPEGSHPALAIRPGRGGHGRGAGSGVDRAVFPAVAVRRAGATRIAAIQGGRLVELSTLFAEEEAEREEDRRDREDEGAADAATSGFLDVLDVGVELVSWLPAFGRSGEVPAPLEVAGAAPGVVDAAAAAPEAASAVVEAASGAGEVAAAAVEAVGRVAEVGGHAVEAVSTATSCLGDASCAAIDCGGF